MMLEKVWTNLGRAKSVAAQRVPTATIVREGSLLVNFQKTVSRLDMGISVQLNELNPSWMLFLNSANQHV